MKDILTQSTRLAVRPGLHVKGANSLSVGQAMVESQLVNSEKT
jgi:hypothetical protein